MSWSLFRKGLVTFCGIGSLVGLLALSSRAEWISVWTIGNPDGEISEFGPPNFKTNAPPGSAVAKDDDFYLRGTYPSPIGVVATDEPWTQFPNSFPPQDPLIRVHFNLSADQALPTAQFRLTLKVINGRGSDDILQLPIAGFGVQDLSVLLNNSPLTAHSGLTRDTWIVDTFNAGASAPIVAGANTIEFSRSGGTTNGFFSLDFVQFDMNPTAMRDADHDGIPEYWEQDNGMSDSDPSDATLDFDRDGLNNLQEYLAGTQPRVADTDGDGLSDGEEVTLGTNPVNADTDGDGLSDSREIRQTHTDPKLADTDGDGASDADEIRVGTNPLDPQSRPFAFANAVGVQFLSQDQTESKLLAQQLTGVVPQHSWNVTRPLPSLFAVTGTTAAVQYPLDGVLVDAAGKTTTTQIRWACPSGAFLTGRKGNADQQLQSGLLEASFFLPLTVDLSQIPYRRYDLYVYVGARYENSSGQVQRDGLPSTLRYFSTGTPDFPDGFLEATSTIDSYARGNFIRYSNLTNSAVHLEISASDIHTGLQGIQIVESETDTDSDGMPDSWELRYRLNPAINDAALDADVDGLSNLSEFQRGTDPQNPDTDGDGLPDGAETGTGIFISATDTGSNPLIYDTDQDGLPDGDEVLNFWHPSNPNKADSDGDGFSDLDERMSLSEPSDANNTPARVPVYSASANTWTWSIDQLQLIWDHRKTVSKADPFDRETIFTAAVWNASAGSSTSDLEMTLRFGAGSLNWLFRCAGNGSFSYLIDGTDVFVTDPNYQKADLLHALGFSGYGPYDTSSRLRLSLTAQGKPEPENVWRIVFEIFNYDTQKSVVRSEVINLKANTSLQTGTAKWMSSNGSTNRSTLTAMSGFEVVFSPISVESRLPAAFRDSDNDGMPDLWESSHGLDPSNATDASADSDQDGLTNLAEYQVNTDPHAKDTDKDGAPDGYEVTQSSNPLDPVSVPSFYLGLASGPGDDFNANGLSDTWEVLYRAVGLIPSADNDGDGMSNLAESIAGTNPLDPASKLELIPTPNGSAIQLSWSAQPFKVYTLLASTNLTDWAPFVRTIVNTDALSVITRDVPASTLRNVRYQAFRVTVSDQDTDGDRLNDWAEYILGSDPRVANANRQPAVIDTNRDGIPDFTLSGDLARAAELLGTSESISSQTPTRVQASRFLSQATFGPTLKEIDRVISMGFTAWIQDQIYTQATYLHEPYILAAQADLFGSKLQTNYYVHADGDFLYGENVRTPFARGALQHTDQLRQRMAFALNQIIIISRKEPALEGQPRSLDNFYDILVRNAFGNYRDILMQVTLHPAMGRYLSHIGNEKAHPEVNQFPDENYARELMQLFSIGLWQLNPDGSRTLDSQGNPIPTYSNADITQLARVMTGLWYADRIWGEGGYFEADFSRPMQMDPTRHDFGAKTLLNGLVIPARAMTTEEGLHDIQDAVDYLFHHPNTPVFVSQQLIQFFVTSNPSGSYVKRVQDVFVNNGQGVRGDLGAVITAILMDDEARKPDYFIHANTSGKVREPVIRSMALAKVLHIGTTDPELVWWDFGDYFHDTFQEPLFSPSVFNFYRPDYIPPTDLGALNFVAPVLQITDSFTSIATANRVWDTVDNGFQVPTRYHFPADYSDLVPLVANPTALLDRLDLLFCQGGMTAQTRRLILQALSEIPLTNPSTRLKVAVGLAAASPEGATDR